MAVKQNFVVQSGLEVADSAVVTGVFKASGLTYPTADGNNNEVIKTNGSGSLSFGTLSSVAGRGSFVGKGGGRERFGQLHSLVSVVLVLEAASTTEEKSLLIDPSSLQASEDK